MTTPPPGTSTRIRDAAIRSRTGAERGASIGTPRRRRSSSARAGSSRPLPADEEHGRRRADHATQSGRRAEEPDAAVAETEEVDREDRVEDVERTDKERRPRSDRDDRAEPAIGKDGGDPADRLGQAVSE